MNIPIVFLDTCVLKSAVRIPMTGKVKDLLDDKGNLVGRQVPIINRNFNDTIMNNPAHQQECNLVEEVATLVTGGVLRAVTSTEALMEFARLPKTFPLAGGPFHGAHYDIVNAPVSWSYTLTRTTEALLSLLEAVSDARYVAIRKQVGAYQGNNPVKINQLLDALLLWTAETAGCQYFLTVDQKLIDYPFQSGTLTCLNPSSLLATFQGAEGP